MKIDIRKRNYLQLMYHVDFECLLTRLFLFHFREKWKIVIQEFIVFETPLSQRIV